MNIPLTSLFAKYLSLNMLICKSVLIETEQMLLVIVE